jgi:hypothetical protein
MLAQYRDDRRLGRQLLSIRLAVAVSEAPARLGDADEVMQTQTLAHMRQDFERQLEHGHGWPPWRSVHVKSKVAI